MANTYLKTTLLLILLLCAPPMFSQITTSSISGIVTDDMGTIIGATVIITHEPSGTTYGTITNDNGRYSLTGMRTGGPYKAEVMFLGYGTNTVTGISLNLGETYVHNVKLVEESVSLGEVVISAEKTRLSTEKTGASTNINNRQLTQMPTINRNIQDITRLSPYASGMSFGGSDGRSSNFTLDGANFNNNFGLSANLPGGGNPISLDVIEEVQVVVAPYDVRQTNFIGGGVNAITKSGTNQFKGAGYIYYTNQDMRGNRVGDQQFGNRPDESKTIYGASIGGPIIKNKLFFFANIETEKQPTQVVTWRASEDGIMNLNTSTSRTKAEDMKKVQSHLKDKYGYDPGSFTNFPGDENNIKLLARIDWNIDNNHKLSMRYNHTKNEAWNGPNDNSTDAGARNRNMNRVSQHGMAFANALYRQDNTINSFTAELNSRFTAQMSNQLLVTYTDIQDKRHSPSSPFPFIDILAGRDANNVPIIEPYMSAGYELFTWNNAVNNKVLTVTDNFTLYLQNHKLTAGISYEHQVANNSYMRNGTGYYRYASVDEFLSQAAPIDFALTYGYGGEANPAAEVKFHQFGIYAQDEWNITPAFKLTYGLRADYLAFLNDLMPNNSINNMSFGDKKIDSGAWPSSRILLSPRVGFTWDIKGNQSIKLRGGTGIFTGRLPLVFFTNTPTNSGMIQGSYAAKTEYKNNQITNQSPDLAKLAGPMLTDVNEMIDRLGLQKTITPDQGALPNEISAIDKNFNMPQVWKTSLALDYRIPVSFPLNVTVEGIYTKSINAVYLKNYDLKQPDGTWQRLEGKDDRYIYPKDHRYNKKSAFVLSNTNRGWGMIGNITVTAEPVKDLNLMAAYTYTESKEISGMPGSNAGSAYGGLYMVDGPHLPDLQRSQYVVPNKVIGSLAYRIPWQNSVLLANTTINLFYVGESPRGYSYTYVDDLNEDGYKTDLIFVPAQKGDIKFSSAADEDAFFAFIEQDSYLKSRKGKYAEAYKVTAPWRHRFDLRLTRDLILNVGKTKHTLQLSLDFLNVGNMINSKWGVTKNNYIANNGQILSVKKDGNVPTYSFVKDKAGDYLSKSFDRNYHYSENWKLQVGVRYIFN